MHIDDDFQYGRYALPATKPCLGAIISTQKCLNPRGAINGARRRKMITEAMGRVMLKRGAVDDRTVAQSLWPDQIQLYGKWRVRHSSVDRMLVEVPE